MCDGLDKPAGEGLAGWLVGVSVIDIGLAAGCGGWVAGADRRNTKRSADQAFGPQNAAEAQEGKPSASAKAKAKTRQSPGRRRVERHLSAARTLSAEWSAPSSYAGLPRMPLVTRDAGRRM